MRCESIAFIVKFYNLSVWVSWLSVVSLHASTRFWGFTLGGVGCLGFL